jgi:hypothetical protein
MAEPLFFDCLTDAQFWSLFESGVLQSYRLPPEVYERLRGLASDHGCVLFTWPAGTAVPAPRDVIPDLAAAAEDAQASPHGRHPQTPLSPEALRSAVEAYRQRACLERPSQDRPLQVMSLNPDLDLRAGPYLEPPAHDLHAMSLPELEAYLNEVLRLDESR